MVGSAVVATVKNILSEILTALTVKPRLPDSKDISEKVPLSLSILKTSVKYSRLDPWIKT